MKKIGKNVSSGAEKVENAAKKRVEEDAAQAYSEAAREERAAADARFEAAKAREVKKQAARTEKGKKLEARAKARERRMEERAAAHSERAERRAQKAARREMLAAESDAEKKARPAREKRERAAKAARRDAERERAHHVREEKKKEAHARRVAAREKKKRERAEARKQKGRAPGIGGWIAAVTTLGAACLALATAVTAGALRMEKMAVQAENARRATLFELVAAAEMLDDGLAKLRVSSGAEEQRMLAVDILTNTAVMESALERIPVGAEADGAISAFINRTHMFACRMLQKLSAGVPLSAREKELAAHLYEGSAVLARSLNDFALNTPASELGALFGGETDGLDARFAEWGEALGAPPERITDAPFFGEGNVEENGVEALPEIGEAEAEEAVRAFFEGYHIAEVRMTGETSARDMQCYNFLLIDEGGAEIFAQVTKRGGKVAFFDTYEACSVKNFDLASCDAVARAFLAERGMGDLAAAWFSDAGMVASIAYVAEVDGVRCYPAMVQVRVCEEKGRVVGMDARGYLLNHQNSGRETQPEMSEGEARALLAPGLTVEASNLAVIPVGRREVLCYEFACTFGEEQYLIYLNAATGSEVRIFRVHESARGNYLS